LIQSIFIDSTGGEA